MSATSFSALSTTSFAALTLPFPRSGDTTSPYRRILTAPAPPPLINSAASSSPGRRRLIWRHPLLRSRPAAPTPPLDDLYHLESNPTGMINLGLAENHVRVGPTPTPPLPSFVCVLPVEWNSLIDVGASVQQSLNLVGRWMEEHARATMLEGMTAADDERDLTVRGLATYQPYDGILALKMALAGFMRQVMHESVSVDPSEMVITSGATPLIEILSFCLTDPGHAFLVPPPYYPGY
ncbi:hypothetical protein PR202_gb10787 [Eleusine coracana subsp. coracana]|uniref:Aminotransferase class I/classII large domain-containing protein n=1 Tax=Eleusine coracana subsp. coracana TaxID=191504 RepID=A0AAV5EK74_ELECO|nr:hypothetical protein PR202_gb10787 [Eleusine coracana subsp. coracana]